MIPHEVMELGESSWAWTMARSWSFAKFTGLDLVHGEVMELGENSWAWAMDGEVIMELGNGESKSPATYDICAP